MCEELQQPGEQNGAGSFYMHQYTDGEGRAREVRIDQVYDEIKGWYYPKFFVEPDGHVTFSPHAHYL